MSFISCCCKIEKMLLISTENWSRKDWNILYREQTEVRTRNTCFLLLYTFDSILKSFPVPDKKEEKTDRKITTLHSSMMFLFFPFSRKLIHFSLWNFVGQNVCVSFCIIKSIESPTNYINKLYFISLTLLFVIHSIRLVILFWTSTKCTENKNQSFASCASSRCAYRSECVGRNYTHSVKKREPTG